MLASSSCSSFPGQLHQPGQMCRQTSSRPLHAHGKSIFRSNPIQNPIFIGSRVLVYLLSYVSKVFCTLSAAARKLPGKRLCIDHRDHSVELRVDLPEVESRGMVKCAGGNENRSTRSGRFAMIVVWNRDWKTGSPKGKHI